MYERGSGQDRLLQVRQRHQPVASCGAGARVEPGGLFGAGRGKCLADERGLQAPVPCHAGCEEAGMAVPLTILPGLARNDPRPVVIVL